VTIVVRRAQRRRCGTVLRLQGDNSGGTAGRGRQEIVVADREESRRLPDHRKVLGRIVNRSGPESQPIMVQVNRCPTGRRRSTPSAHADRARARNRRRQGDRALGHSERRVGVGQVRRGACFPGRPTRLTSAWKKGFDPKLLPGRSLPGSAGARHRLAAFRDVGAFFRYADKDDAGTRQSDRRTHAGSSAAAFSSQATTCGSSSTSASTRTSPAASSTTAPGRSSRAGASRSISAGRSPTACSEAYQAGSEGPQWWAPWDDKVRGLPRAASSIRCMASRTCLEDHRALRLGRGVGAERRPNGSAPTRQRTSRCPRTCAAITSPAPRTAAA
jgi:hypothetical protein